VMRLISGLLAFTVSLFSFMLPLGGPSNSLAAVADSQTSVVQEINSYSLGSPSLLWSYMWLSGSNSASAGGASDIYESTYGLNGGSTWSTPTLVFSLPGYQVSDPSVVQDPQTPTSLLMYYTKLPDADVGTTSEALDNQIGLAQSSDNGRSWTDSGIIIGQNNGIDNRGGWAPSAVMGNQGQMWVYYSTNGPGAIAVYRARLDLEGRQLLGSDKVVGPNDVPLSLFNVDVSWDGSQYVMYANPNLSSIVEYVSTDGIHWSAPPSGSAYPVVADASSIVGAPASQYPSDGTTLLTFAGGTLSDKRWDSVDQVPYTQGPSSTVTFSDSATPTATTNPTNSVGNTTNGTTDNTSDTSSGSSGSNSTAIIAGVGLLGVAGIVAYSLFGGAAVVAAPVAASAAGEATGVSFGGRIAVLTPCFSALGPSIWVQLVPSASPLLPPYEYIWTPATLLHILPPEPSIPPSHPGQEILGRFDIPFFCVVPFPPFVFYGLRMQTEGVSPA
jgi:hypothetical protein